MVAEGGWGVKKMDLRSKFSLSTIADDAATLARENGLGLEIAEFCTASNMDADYQIWDAQVKQKMTGITRFFFHAPFGELCPAAIDPLIADVAKLRYEQAYLLMHGYGINDMVVHSGYLPVLYRADWFIAHSLDFWKTFLDAKPGTLKIYIENVFEETPALLYELVKEVNDARFKLCLDVGHAAMRSEGASISEWVRQVAPFLGHVHLHNNDGRHDTHHALGDGVCDMAALIREISALAPEATFTIETIDAESSVKWMKTKGFLS